jgi:hypothetical protein
VEGEMAGLEEHLAFVTAADRAAAARLEAPISVLCLNVASPQPRLR